MDDRKFIVTCYDRKYGDSRILISHHQTIEEANREALRLQKPEEEKTQITISVIVAKFD